MGPLTNTYGNNPSAWSLLPLDKIARDMHGWGRERDGLRIVPDWVCLLYPVLDPFLGSLRSSRRLEFMEESRIIFLSDVNALRNWKKWESVFLLLFLGRLSILD